MLTARDMTKQACIVCVWFRACVGNEESVTIRKAVSSGTFIRPIGSDVASGQTVLRSGQVITPAEVGLLASVRQLTFVHESLSTCVALCTDHVHAHAHALTYMSLPRPRLAHPPCLFGHAP